MGKTPSKKNNLSTISYDTGGLYGSGKSGGVNSFTPTSFQKYLVEEVENTMPQYLRQLTNPTYDSTVFQAQTAARNKLANQSFENNLITPLTQRGLTRGSSVNQLSSNFANSLAHLEKQAMGEEDARVQNIVNQLMNLYQVPYSMMNGLQNSKQSLSNAATQQNMTIANNKEQFYNNLLGSAKMAALAV